MADLEDLADQLYGLLPEEFIGARDERVRQARDAGDRALAKDLAGLRKPSAAAWVVNLLVREQGDQVVALLDLGESLRTAQAALAGDQLKELGKQRAQVVSAMAREGRRLAREVGHPVSAGIEDEVAQTLRAALADPAAAQAVRSGRLTSALSYAGLGELDVSGVVALAPRRAARVARRPDGADVADVADTAPSAGGADGEWRREEDRRQQEARRREAELEQARAALADAEDAVDAARSAERLAADALDEVQEESQRRHARVAELEEALRRAQEAAGQASAAVRPRRREQETARHALDVATRALQRAQAQLDRLGG